MPAKKAVEAPDEPVDAEVVPEQADVSPEVAAAVEDALASQAVTVTDPADEHAGMVAMDAHDAAAFVDRLTTQAMNANLGKRWVYQLPRDGAPAGLTGDAVEDITQQMSWSGRARIHSMPETLQVEQIEADEGDGPEPFWVATIAAADDIGGSVFTGTSMEPQKLKLKASTADARRKKGAAIPEDNRVFDRYARAKAINKAERNALEKHIPTIVKLTLVAMAKKDPSLIEHIESDAEAKAKELPPPLDTDEARALIAELGEIYDGVGALGGGKGRMLLTPGTYHQYLIQSHHSMELLARMREWLLQRREQIEAEVVK